jgi:hypothetical protein
MAKQTKTNESEPPPRTIPEAVFDQKPVYTAYSDGTYTLTVGQDVSALEDIGLSVRAGNFIGTLLEDEEGNLLAGPVVAVSGSLAGWNQTIDVAITEEGEEEGDEGEEGEEEDEDGEGDDGDDEDGEPEPQKPIATKR